VRVVRGIAGALLWIVASVVCLLALVLCATLVLLPLGIPLFLLGRRLFGMAIRLFLPPAAAHPVKASGKAAKSTAQDLVDGISERVPRPDGRKARKQLKKKWKKVAHA
jgi:hypothetical protein